MFVYILHERLCPDIFYGFSDKVKPHIFNLSLSVPESPIYCLNTTLEHLKGLESCAPESLSILNDMKSLTDAFLLYHLDKTTTQPFGDSPDFISYAKSIRNRLSARPPASVIGSPISEDYYYEFIRLASLIYTESLVSCIPFSSAIRSLDSRTPATRLNILQSMFLASSKTVLTNCWGGMAGVLLWGSLVGATAAKGLPAEGSKSLAVNEQSRRWLTVSSLGCMVIIATEHTAVVTESAKKMLKIQRILSGGRDETIKTSPL
jgi:hypothetical protein